MIRHTIVRKIIRCADISEYGELSNIRKFAEVSGHSSQVSRLFISKLITRKIAMQVLSKFELLFYR